MNQKDLKQRLPKSFEIISEPTLIGVYSRGKIDEDPKDYQKKYVPEGTIYDIPRSFITSSNLASDCIYRETSFLHPPLRQRPIVLKFLVQCSKADNFPIYVIESKGEISRRLKEISSQTEEIERMGLEVSWLIILTNEKILPVVRKLQFPSNTFISYYTNTK